MTSKRIKLDNALRRAMLQRAALKRKLTGAGDELSPRALVSRGKQRIGEKVDDVALGAQQTLKRYRLPLTLAAVAGIGYALRGPIQRLAPALWDQLRSLTDRDDDAVPNRDSEAQDDPAPPPFVENDNETL